MSEWVQQAVEGLIFFLQALVILTFISLIGAILSRIWRWLDKR